MQITLKLYVVVTEPGPAICGLTDIPLGGIARIYVLARHAGFAAQRVSQVIGRIITTNRMAPDQGEPWARALIESGILSRQNEMAIIGYHAHQSTAVVHIDPRTDGAEVLGHWKHDDDGSTWLIFKTGVALTF